jgi:hypothetical protein
MELILLLEAQNGIEKNQNYHLKERRQSLHFVSYVMGCLKAFNAS